MARPTTFAVALGMAPSASLVDVSAFLDSDEDFDYQWGRVSMFEDAEPGVWSCTLKNPNGWLTPGNMPVVFAPTTLAAAASAGDKTISSSTLIPAGAFLAIDNGSTIELATAGAATGSGPFTIPLLSNTSADGTYALVNSHANGAVVSPQIAPVEGMVANWQYNSRLIAGVITGIAPTFPNGIASWAEVQITVTDQLGQAARNQLGPLAGSMVMASDPYAYWPLNDAADAIQAADVSGNAQPLQNISNSNTAVVFGVADPGPLEETCMAWEMSNASAQLKAAGPTVCTPNYASGSRGFIGCWVAMGSQLSAFALSLNWGLSDFIEISCSSGLQVQASCGSAITASYTATPGAFVYYAAGVTWTLAAGIYTWTVTFYANGTLIGTATRHSFTLPGPAVTAAVFAAGDIPTETITVAHLSHTPTLIHEEYAGLTNEANRFAAIAAADPSITVGTVSANLSTAPVGPARTNGQSATDAMNALAKTEQGHIYCSTSGTLTSPAQVTNFQSRVRSQAIPDAAHTFDAQNDLQGAIDLLRDPTYVVQTINATGIDPNGNQISVTFTDPTMAARIASANDDFDTLFAYESDVYVAASDRLYRAKSTILSASEIVYDQLAEKAARINDFLALQPADRVRISNLDEPRLGFSTWNGWLIGGSETHTTDSFAFTPYLDPCMPATAVLDATLLDSGGNNPLSVAITSTTATSMTVSSVDGVTWFDQVDVPYYLGVDAEVMEVTAAGAPSAGSQVLTVTRGQNGTVAGTHAVGAVPEVVADGSDTPNNAILAY